MKVIHDFLLPAAVTVSLAWGEVLSALRLPQSTRFSTCKAFGREDLSNFSINNRGQVIIGNNQFWDGQQLQSIEIAAAWNLDGSAIWKNSRGRLGVKIGEVERDEIPHASCVLRAKFVQLKESVILPMMCS